MVDTDLTGYTSPIYAGALSHIGKPIRLPRSGTWVLRRPIPGTDYYDAMGLYPLTCCRDASLLPADMACLHDMVSLVFVADPFMSLDGGWLDVYRPYKHHYAIDYQKGVTISKHHRYYAKRSGVTVETLVWPQEYLSEWRALYGTLIDRHEITGVQVFSEESFRQQFDVPGLVAFRAYYKGDTHGMHLWYAQGDVAYSHLAACSPAGYASFAAYALMDAAIKFFCGDVRYLDLGGVADDSSNGLTFFKSGWANTTKQAHLCGEILRPDIYEELTGERETDYFPAYRG